MQNRFFCFLCITIFCCAFTNCSQAEANVSSDSSYGEGINYYLGLKLLEENNIVEALEKFNQAAKNGSYYTSRKSMEQLTKVGEKEQRVAASESLVKKFPDEKAFLVAAREYAADEEFSKLIATTESIDVVTCSNELARWRMTALHKENDSRFWDSVYKWFVSRQYSEQHEFFFGEHFDILWTGDWHDEIATKNSKSLHDVNNELENLSMRRVMTLRREIYLRRYQSAHIKSAFLLKKIKNTAIELPHFVVSDMGRAFLYSNNHSSEDINLFVNMAGDAERKGNNLLAFYARFYAARLSERAGKIHTAKSHFEQAMAAARLENDSERFDNALWYLFNCVLANTLDEVVPAVRTYCMQWHDASYFDDFFEKLSLHLFTASRWHDFRQLAFVIDGYASKKITAQYSYIYARLLESGIAHADEDDVSQIKHFYERATDAGGVSYYAMLAGVKLGLSDEQIMECITVPSEKKLNSEKEVGKNVAGKDLNVKEIDRFMQGYVEFDLADYIYDDWQSFYDDGIRLSLETDELLAVFLQQCGARNDKYLPQSMRIVFRSIRNRTETISKEMLRLLFPKNFEKLVEGAAEKYSLSPELLFAMIHSESFFQVSVKSSAGAAGLTQLMKATATDVAQRLKRKEYDVTKPEDSIEFGAYYLGNLIDRLDNLPILAIFAYNAGITRVRRWLGDVHKELHKNLEGNYDLFLEIVPFEETRGYGRNVISAAMMYGMLHYGKDAATIVDELM